MRVDAIVTKPKKESVPNNSKRVKGGVIHHVHILDSSVSMRGGKYDSAAKGIELDIRSIQQSRKDFPELMETMTVVEFDTNRYIKTHYLMKKVEDVSPFVGYNHMGGGTALYQTIGETINVLLKNKAKEDKVVLKIFTDGGENDSRGEYANSSVLRALIVKVEEEDNFTVTFVGTDYDVKTITNKLSIDVSNTLIHDNTTRGVEMAFMTGAFASVSYRKDVSLGNDVSKGYYTKTVEK